MVLRLCTLALAGLLALLALPATGLAQGGCGNQTTTPPGNSEVDQYTETVPGACGNQSPGGGGGSTDGSGGSDDGSAVPQSTVDQLSSEGAAGEAAAGLAVANAPRANQGGGGSASESNGSDDGGMGLLLPLILAGVAGAGIAYVFLRRRAGHA